MKLLLFFVLFFSYNYKSHAGYKFTRYTLSDSYQGDFTVESIEEGKSKILEMISKSNWMECDWKDIEEGSVTSKEDINGDGNTIVRYCHPKTFKIVVSTIEDTSTEQAIEQAIEAKLKCGQETIKLISKLNVMKGLNNEQIKQVALSYSVIFSLLNAGAMDTALIEINNSTPDGTLITYDDKTKVVNFINTCN